MRFGRTLNTVLAGVTVLLWVASAPAQQISYVPDFSSGASALQLMGSAHVATYQAAKVLRLTDGYPGVGATHPETSAAWFALPSSVDANLGRQQVSMGFTTYFKFQIHTATICCTPADGFAFVIQNSLSTALGSGSGGLGYAGIPNSLAVEFDTYQNPWDPNANHVAVQSCGTQANAPNHVPGNCLVGSVNSTTIPTLGVTCGTSGPCKDGSAHEVVIDYTPPANGTGNGTLVVWIDPLFVSGTHQPVPTAVKAINIPYNIDIAQNSQGISLAGGTSAWVGFTGSQTSDPQAQDVLAWEFTPHVQTQVTHVIQSGGTEVDYTFGGHHMGVNYFSGFVNNGCNATDNDPNNPCLMTVVAKPVGRSKFHHDRLLGTNFINEQCVVYLETGGNCIVYSVTCAYKNNPTVTVPCPFTPNKCPNVDPTLCITFNTSFYTTDPITPKNADYLKADPVGTNNWISIFVSYDPNVLDGKTTGTGNTPSDFVATFALGAGSRE